MSTPTDAAASRLAALSIEVDVDGDARLPASPVRRMRSNSELAALEVGAAFTDPTAASPKLASPYKDARRSPSPLKRGFKKQAASFTDVGRKRENQDRWLMVERFAGLADATLAAVLDGHGEYGAEVAAWCKDELPRQLAADPKRLAADPAAAITAAFAATDAALTAAAAASAAAAEASEDGPELDVEYSGTTVTLALLLGTKLFTANLGDSRAVLACTAADGALTAVQLTHDHKPTVPAERARILAAGGRVCRHEKRQAGPLRVWLAEVWAPGLAVARAFGDSVAHECGVSSVPDVSERQLGPETRGLLLATDGVWDVMDAQGAVDCVAPNLGAPDRACEALIHAAQAGGSGDNVTALLLAMTPSSPVMRRPPARFASS